MRAGPAGALVIAHRGGRYPGVPGEQTVPHFERAIALGADYVEVDLRRTSDGEVVCVHDPDHAGVIVAEVPYDALVRASVAAGVPAPPTLAGLLAACHGRIRLDLELKVAGIEAQVLAEVRRGSSLDRVVLKSFDDAVVRALKRLEPGCVAGLLLGMRKPRGGALGRLGELFPGLRLRACRADFVSPYHRLVRFGFVRRMHLQGYPVWVWTVNETEHLRDLLPHVDGLVTDEVETCLSLRRGRAAGPRGGS